MAKNYRGGGKLITRLLGRLEIYHGDGVIEFRLRSEPEIERRGVRTVLRIEGLPDIPRIEKGKNVTVRLSQFTDLLESAKVVDFEEKRHEKSYPDNSGRSKGVA